MGEIPASELYDGRMIWMCKNCKRPLSLDNKKFNALKIAAWGACEETKGLLKVWISQAYMAKV